MPLCVRWTIGDVTPFGVEALRLSMWGALRAFGARARYVVGVHGVAVDRARALVAPAPDIVEWRAIDPGRTPRWLAREGAPPRALARFAPPLVDLARAELAIDRTCVLLEPPKSVLAWLDDPDPRACLVLEAQDGTASTAIRGAGVGFDLSEALREAHREAPRPLHGLAELETLELHALSLLGPPHRTPHAELDAQLGARGARLTPPTDPASRARFADHAAELRLRAGVPPGPPLARTVTQLV